MKSFSLTSFGAIAALMIALVVSVSTRAQSPESVYGPVVGTIAVPPGLTTEGVRTIVASCFAAREWTVRESVGNRVIGYLNHRGVMAQMTVICDSQQVVMYSNGWKLDRAGQPVVPEQPERWISNLRQDIAKRMAKSGLAR